MASDNLTNISLTEEINGLNVLVKKKSSSRNFSKKCCQSKGDKILLGAGLLLFLLGLVLHCFWEHFLEQAINKEFILTKDSTSFKLWVKNPIPLYINFYFFNWTNPNDLKNPGYKPVFEEVGPYRFREDVEKVDVIWNDNGTVTYKKLRRWYFDAENSNGTLDDPITSLNVIALSAVRTTRNWPSVARMPLALAIGSTQRIHVTKRAGEFLFEGFSDPLIEVATKIPGLSSQVPFDRFGWFYKRNGSTEFDGVFNIETGVNGMFDFGKLKNWNYNNHTPYYEGHCGDVTGSGGEFWPPKRTKTDDVSFFAPDLCRYVTFKYTKEVDVNGINGYRYDAGAELFDNGTLNQANECFCGGECVPSGTVNVSTCRFGAPGFVSYPHFFRADPAYRNNITGMNPDPNKHDMYIILEPNLGIPLEVAARLQINILLRPDSRIRMYDGVPRIFFPIIWFEQKVETPDELLASLRLLLALPVVGLTLSIILIFFGLSFILLFFIKIFYCKEKSEKHSYAMKEEEIPVKLGNKIAVHELRLKPKSNDVDEFKKGYAYLNFKKLFN